MADLTEKLAKRKQRVEQLLLAVKRLERRIEKQRLKESKRPRRKDIAWHLGGHVDCEWLRNVAALLLKVGFQQELRIVWNEAGSHYLVDFAHIPKRLIVEYDGKNHDSPTQLLRDAKRDGNLKKIGWKVLRVKHDEPDLTRVTTWLEGNGLGHCL